ncbi:hypothetical protein [Ralstonia pickettii]|uniref:hypothetical protein n=1 Tax=Ralstonia pickettii TaxID=329 RepID=UPI000468077A|nr:hypothetical protein [Ralstonia pickettii]
MTQAHLETTAMAHTRYGAALEKDLFDRVAAVHAPHLPPARTEPPRDAQTAEELEGVIDYAVWNAAHDLFIVQLASAGLDRLFRNEPDFQLALSRQIGDDGFHAVASRERIRVLSGHDQIERIAREVRHHWDVLGDYPLTSQAAFLAWEFHYEHHILARLQVNRRTSRVLDVANRDFAENRIMPDEEVHRILITEWWHRKLDAASDDEREQLVGEVLDADDKLQVLLGDYLRESWALNERAAGIDTRNYVPLYDAWRREILGVLLQRPADTLPALTSLAS